MEIQPEVLLDFNTFHLSLFSLNLWLQQSNWSM
jgi:hypothetical protein